VRARPFSYAINSMTMPTIDVRVDLTGPDGDQWTWGSTDDETPQSVSGSALDFCLVVTQRRHLDDVNLRIVGDAAVEWMAIAQAFAGGVGGGRQPGQFAPTP
jgi:uncharacterized protein (TIGR03084 family)